jgi:L-ascorbate metabolism protein UlaG (beta-lactamase superfamily)
MNPSSPPDIESGSLTFIGTATTLIRFGDFTLLSDPNFLHRGEEVHLGYGLHARRLTNPAMELGELPPLDLVVLSHMHEDHFDRVVQARLDHDVSIVTTGDAAEALSRLGFRAPLALHTWQTWSFRKGDVRLRITALPARHTPLAVMQPLLPRVMGSLLAFSRVSDDAPLLRVYVSGDTLLHSDLQEIPRRFPDIDLGLFHLGGTRIFGVLLTMDGQQGAEAVRIIAPQRAVPIHYDDYEVFKSPLDEFRQAVQKVGLAERVHYLARGQSLVLAPRLLARA